MVKTSKGEILRMKRMMIPLVLAFLIMACWPFFPPGVHKIDVTGLPFKGSPDAPVTVAVFSDYQ
jgi:hypothetical protein